MIVMGATKSHFDGQYLGIRVRDNWEFVTRINATSVAVLVPVTDQDELVLVEQFRIPVQSAVIELPAGLVGDLDDSEGCTRKTHRGNRGPVQRPGSREYAKENRELSGRCARWR